MTNGFRNAALAVVLIAGAVGTASAQFSIDNMLVYRPTVGTYVDEFSDGVAPPAGGPVGVFEAGVTLATYFLNTGASFAPGSESGGLLHFDRGGAAPNCTTFFGCPLQQRVYLDTGVAPGATSGLRRYYDFYIATNWVLTNPAAGEDFRISLNDTFSGAAANDAIDIRLRAGAAGPQVAFRSLDLSNGAVNNIASVDLGATTATNIVFYFAHASGSSFVNAAYQLVQGAQALTGIVSLGQAELFRGEDATRFSFGASFAPAVPAVPEPGTYALMIAGLGVIGWMARRRRTG